MPETTPAFVTDIAPSCQFPLPKELAGEENNFEHITVDGVGEFLVSKSLPSTISERRRRMDGRFVITGDGYIFNVSGSSMQAADQAIGNPNFFAHLRHTMDNLIAKGIQIPKNEADLNRMHQRGVLGFTSWRIGREIVTTLPFTDLTDPVNLQMMKESLALLPDSSVSGS